MINENPFSNDKKRQRRKNKKARFMRNAKGFAKQGIYGRGSHIDDDQYNYFINTLDVMKNGFDDISDKENMANNVFEWTKEQEVHLASNQIACKVLESLIGFVDAEQLERFFTAFRENLRVICSDRFASHVLQKMVEIAFLRYVGTENKKDGEDEEGTSSKRAKVDMLSEENFNLTHTFSKEHKTNCGDFVLRVGKFVLNNLEEYIWDNCGNHILRTCIFCLAGIHVPKVAFEKSTTELAKNRQLYTVPDEWLEVMKEYPQRLEMWPQFVDFPYDENSSALTSVICIALKVVDKNMLKHFGKKIIVESFLKINDNEEDQDDLKMEVINNIEKDDEIKKNSDEVEKVKLPQVFGCQSSVILLETLLTIAGPKLFNQIYCMLFTGRLAYLARNQQTNFAVQKLLQNIKEKEDFEQIFTELVPHIDELLKIGHTGVVSSLSSTCLRLCTKQAQMITALQTAMQVAGDKEKSKLFFLCLIKLKPYHIVLEDKTAFVHLHGSLIVQDILKYNKPIFMITCILETSADLLATILNTPNGSHIADAFLQSKFVGEKSREKFVRLLDGFYIDLAITKFGSHVVENLFSAAQEAQKIRIVKELAEKSNMLKSTPFGRLLYNKLRVETYRLSSTQWKAGLTQKANKAEKLFKDIIN
ncbi:nucleolar protein 9 [Teleopsis dalmanni]|uniref:nucleolar protein 9 n=1 Tax=Teleopsis dalmanni TaxID=139649 RepID=UPI000D32BBAE|nr:nucleolar protein 9 [Teleopsis dalmanni]